MMTRNFLGVALAAATALGATLAATHAEARWYDASAGTWRDGEPVKRNLTDRKPAAKFKRRIVSIRTNEAPGTIIIHTDEKFLYYVTGRNKAIRYGVGVGREGFGWNGVVNIKRKQEWPVWTPPPEMIAREKANGHILPPRMEGGPENPLGARAMYLYQGGHDTMYRIHGTNQPWSIGLNLSSGCIRMMNEDVTDLYERASVGTKVIVVGPGENPNQYFTEVNNPLQMFMDSFARN